MEVLKESGGLEEKEEGIWPTAPAPWEASFVGTTLDPLMLDPGRERGGEGGGEGRVHGTEGKERSTDLFFLAFIHIYITDDFDEEEMGMMAMLEEVRKEGRQGGREGGREGAELLTTSHSHSCSNISFSKQEESDAEAEDEDNDDDLDLEEEEEEDDFEEEQDVDLFLGNMDYREDDEVGREGGREGRERAYSKGTQPYLLGIPILISSFPFNTSNRTSTTAGNEAGKPRTARRPTLCKTRSWKGRAAFTSTTMGGKEMKEGGRKGGREARRGPSLAHLVIY